MRTDPITSFRGEHYFLSNYHTAEPFRWRDLDVMSGEHAFGAAKALYTKYGADKELAMAIARAPTPGESKRLGRQVDLDVEFWDVHKVQVMREIVHAKFAGVPRIAGLLINTGCCMLVEGNTWGDKTWGRVKENGKWVGFNLLGVILMEERGYWLHGNSQS